MVTNKCHWFEQRSVINYLVSEKCKPWVTYRRMHDVYREACSSKKTIYKWAKHKFATTRLSGNSLTLH